MKNLIFPFKFQIFRFAQYDKLEQNRESIIDPYLKKQSQSIRYAYCVMRIAKGVSSFVTSEYEEIQALGAVKNKANLYRMTEDRGQTTASVD